MPNADTGGRKFPQIPDGAKTGLKATIKADGRIFKPLGLVADGYEVVDAFKKDGWKVGSHVKSTAKEAAISWGSTAAGAAAGAAIGSVVPVIGTGVGAVVGGIAGGLAPNAVSFVKGLFD